MAIKYKPKYEALIRDHLKLSALLVSTMAENSQIKAEVEHLRESVDELTERYDELNKGNIKKLEQAMAKPAPAPVGKVK